MSGFIKKKEFADMLGVSTRQISNYKKEGKIFGEACGPNGSINPDIAQEQLNVTLDRRGGKRVPMEEQDKQLDTNFTSADYINARSKKEVIAARVAEIKLQELESSLIKKEDVKNALFGYARASRDSLFAIPERIAPLIAHSKDENEIRQLLNKEIRQAIDEFSNAYKNYL